MRMSPRATAALLAGVLSIPLAAAVSAARGQARQPAAHTISQTWLGKLHLTADQQARVQSAGDAYTAAVEKAQSLTAPADKRAALRQARQTYQAAIRAALAPDQQTQLKAMMAEARQFHALGALGNQLAGLNLRDEQKEKIQAIAARYRPQVQALRESLKTAADKKSVRRQMRDLRVKMADEVKVVLTPEQVAQLQPPVGSLKASR